MFNKVQVKYMIAMKLLEDVLKGDNVDRAQAFLDKHHKRVEAAGKYLEEVEDSWTI